MFFSRFVLPVIALACVLCVIAACGGGTAGSFNDALDTPDNSFVGITDGTFKAVRFNEAGIRDAALNSTIGFTSTRTGDFTEVTISVNDTDSMLGVTMELDYDSNRYHPVGSEFLGLIDSPIEAYIPNRVGTVSLGQVAFNEAVRSGDFATVRFADGPGTSLRNASIIHGALLNEQYDAPMLADAFDGFSVETVGVDTTVTIHSVFAQGDGDDNGETNVADLSALVMQGNFTTSVADDNFGPAATDYDRNGEVNLADIAIIAINNQGTVDHINLMVADSADMTGATVLQALLFADGTAADRSGAPFASATWDVVWRTWTHTILGVDATAADVNADGEIFVSAVTADAAIDGTPFTDGVSIPAPIASNVVATAIDVTYGAVAVADGETADVIANNVYTWDITGVSGNYDDGTGPVAFTPADSGTLIPTEDYDAALLAVQGHAIWTVTNTGDADFRATGPALDFGAVPGTGAPIDATAFPDWDDTVAPVDDASLVLSFAPAGGTLTDGLGDTTIGVDVAVDPVAPAVDPTMASDQGLDGDGLWALNPAGESLISGPIVWGTTPPAADADVQVQLYNFDNPGSDIDFAYTTDNPPAAGQFTLGGGGLLIAKVAPVAAGSVYGLRVTNGDPAAAGVYSSINIPGVWYTAGDLPPSVDFETVPETNTIGAGDLFLQLLYPDPTIRRNPNVVWDDILKTFDGADADGYADILKGTAGTSEFPMAYEDAGFERYPRLTVLEGVPDDIGPSTVGDAGAYFSDRNPNKCVIDIAALTTGGGIGDPAVNYAYKLYGKYDNEIGAGTFSVEPMAVDPAAPVGVRWGINVFDRGTLDYAGSDWEGHVLDATPDVATEPDVLFVEFNGGTLDNYPATLGNGNLEIIFFSAGPYNIPVDIRAAGLDALGLNFIAVHAFVDSDYFDPVTNPNGLQVGMAYDIQLDDLATAGTPDFSFGLADGMTIIN